MSAVDSAASRQVSAIELERQQIRAGQRRRSTLLSIGSTVIFLVAIYLLVVNSPGWPVVKDTFFNWEQAKVSFPHVLEGLWLNVRVLFFAVIGVGVVGSTLAILRTLRNPVFTPLRYLAATYVDVIRGVPVLIMLYLIGFGIPGLNMTQQKIPAAVLGTIAIIICYSAYVAEVLRSGIQSVHPSQRIAARSLGLSHAKTLRLVVLPQAVRKVTPALMNDFVSMQKDVGLISVLGVVDAVRMAQIDVAKSFNFTPYVVAGLIFVIVALPFLRWTEVLLKRSQEREQVGGIV